MSASQVLNEEEEQQLSISEQLKAAIENHRWAMAASIFQAHPDECKQQHPQYGWTNLHWLCSIGGSPAELIELVAGLYPPAIVQQDTFLGDTCLHIAARNSQLSALKLNVLLRHHCETAVLIRNRLGGTALHSAANHNAVLPALQALVQANPSILSVTTHEGIYPITALWLAYIQTIPGHMMVVRILQGEIIPRHNNDTSVWDRFWSKVEYLATMGFQNSVSCPKHVNKNTAQLQNYVLHGLLQCNVPINLLLVCLRYRPDSARAVDANGNLPLHVLVENRPCRLKEREAIEAMVSANPGAVGVSNRSADLPLHIAIRNKIPVENGLDLLTRNASESSSVLLAARQRDSQTGLYPFQLAAAVGGGKITAINTVYYLLLTMPDLLHHVDGNTNDIDDGNDVS